METELIKTISHMVLGTSAVIAGITVLIKAGKAIIEYYVKKREVLNNIADITEDVKNIKKEQKICFKALNACLDGLEQLGCNHTVSETKKELEKWLITQAHE